MIKAGKNKIIVNETMSRTTTFLYDGAVIDAVPQDDDEYRQRARDLGYGDDTFAMSRDHEILHSKLAIMLGLKESPTMRGVANQKIHAEFYVHWEAEEAAVLAIQHFIRVAKIRFP